jgi:hypothetical protein
MLPQQPASKVPAVAAVAQDGYAVAVQAASRDRIEDLIDG